MEKLELTVPPVLVFIFFGLIMWILALVTPRFHVADDIRVALSLAFLFTGLLLAILSVAQFRRSKTTIHPMVPAETSTIVKSGVYGFTRNPMYLGLLLILIGWSCYLMAPVSLAISFGFLGYMNRFQIIPEEKILASKFGLEYQEYKRHVPRWGI